MSYVNKKQRIFRLAGNEDDIEARREDGRLKTYTSAFDLRAWCHITEDRRQHILELVRKGGTKKFCLGQIIPFEELIKILCRINQETVSAPAENEAAKIEGSKVTTTRSLEHELNNGKGEDRDLENAENRETAPCACTICHRPPHEKTCRSRKMGNLGNSDTSIKIFDHFCICSHLLNLKHKDSLAEIASNSSKTLSLRSSPTIGENRKRTSSKSRSNSAPRSKAFLFPKDSKHSCKANCRSKCSASRDSSEGIPKAPWKKVGQDVEHEHGMPRKSWKKKLSEDNVGKEHEIPFRSWKEKLPTDNMQGELRSAMLCEKHPDLLENLESVLEKMKRELEMEKQKNLNLINRYANQSKTVENMTVEMSMAKCKSYQDQLRMHKLGATLKKILNQNTQVLNLYGQQKATKVASPPCRKTSKTFINCPRNQYLKRGGSKALESDSDD